MRWVRALPSPLAAWRNLPTCHRQGPRLLFARRLVVTSVGEEYISNQGTNLRLTVKAVSKKDVAVTVERRVVDRKTGELTIEQRERTVPKELWRYVIAGYDRA